MNTEHWALFSSILFHSIFYFLFSLRLLYVYLWWLALLTESNLTKQNCYRKKFVILVFFHSPSKKENRMKTFLQTQDNIERNSNNIYYYLCCIRIVFNFCVCSNAFLNIAQLIHWLFFDIFFLFSSLLNWIQINK